MSLPKPTARRTLEDLGGGNLLRSIGPSAARSLDSLGGGHLLRSLDALGGGGGQLVRNLDSLGGGNLIRSAAAAVDYSRHGSHNSIYN